MKGHNLPDEHHIVRVVSYSRLQKDSDGQPIGLLFSAFQRKENEEGLSVTWMEYFKGSREDRISAAVKAIRASALTVGKKSGFAVGNVGGIKSVCLHQKHKIRIIHWPEDDNKAHAEIRQLPRDDTILLEQLAAGAWSELVLNSNIEPIDAQVPAPDEPPLLG